MVCCHYLVDIEEEMSIETEWNVFEGIEQDLMINDDLHYNGYILNEIQRNDDIN